MKRSTFGLVAAVAVTLSGLLAFAPAAYAEPTQNVTVGSLTCEQSIDTDPNTYPYNGHLFYCATNTTPSVITKAAAKTAVVGRIQGNNMTTSGNWARLRTAGVDFYIFEDINQFEDGNLGYAGNGPVSNNLYRGWSEPSLGYSAVFLAEDTTPSTGSVALNAQTVESTTRHEIGHQLIDIFQIGDDADFLDLVQQDFDRLNAQSSVCAANAFRNKRGNDGNYICISSTLQSPYSSSQPWSDNYKIAFPYYFDPDFGGTGNNNLYIELAAEMMAVLQGGNGDDPIFDNDHLNQNMFKCSGTYAVYFFNTGAAPASNQYPTGCTAP